MPPAEPETNQALHALSTNCFDIWQPLDAVFIYSMFKWCNVENPQFFTFFYSQLLFAYLPYTSQMTSMQPQQIIAAEGKARSQKMQADQFSATGLYYGKMLAAPRQNCY